MHHGKIDYYPGNKTHALFLNIIKKSSERISQFLHDQKSEKPFTVSSFLGTDVEKPIIIDKGRKYYVRLTILDPNVFNLFTKSLLAKGVLHEIVNIANVNFSIERVIFDRRLSAWVGKSNAREILDKSFPYEKISMRFYTPTLFKTGDLHFRYPDPQKIFSSLLKKFNVYSDINIDNSIIERFSEIQISKKKTMRKRIYFKNFYLEGFIGDVEFLLPFSDEYLIKIINALANFSFYSGVGYKTTMGLGQVKVISN